MLFPDPYRKERIREKEYRSEVSDTNYDVNRSVGSSLNRKQFYLLVHEYK